MMDIHFTNPEFGYPRMTTALWEAGLNVNHKKVWRIMRELSIQSVIRRKRKKSSYTPSVIYPNRIKAEIPCYSTPAKNGDGYYLYLGWKHICLHLCDSRPVQQRDCSLAVVQTKRCSARIGYAGAVDTKKRRVESRAPFGSKLSIHVSGVQHTIRSIRRERQPLLQSYLPR